MKSKALSHEEASIYTQIGARIRELRKGQHMKAVELARRCGLSHAMVSFIERAQVRVTIVNLYKIAIALSVTAGELLP